MMETAAEVRRMQAQATRDEQMRRTLVGLFDALPRERKRQLALKRFSQIGFLVSIILVVGVMLIDGIAACVVWGQTGHLQFPGGPPDFQMLTLPLIFWGVASLLYFPNRYVYASIDAFLRVVVTGDVALAPMAGAQPMAELPVAGEDIGPLLRWNSIQMTRARRILTPMTYLMGGFLAVVGLVLGGAVLAFPLGVTNSVDVALTALILALGLLLIGGGAALIVAGWRAGQQVAGLLRDLAVTADANGLAWADPAWRTRRHMRLAWRDVRSFSVATYQREPNGNEWQVYILDGGATRLLWALPFFPSAEKAAAHTRLAGLIVGATGLPLRDITPGLVALGSVIRSANPLFQTKAEKALAATQPTIPGVPLRAMRRWTYGFYGVLGLTLAVTLAYGALSVVATFVR